MQSLQSSTRYRLQPSRDATSQQSRASVVLLCLCLLEVRSVQGVRWGPLIFRLPPSVYKGKDTYPTRSVHRIFRLAAISFLSLIVGPGRSARTTISRAHLKFESHI
ncbi:hypothetical protein EV1_029413 [Malus domestica]